MRNSAAESQGFLNKTKVLEPESPEKVVAEPGGRPEEAVPPTSDPSGFLSEAAVPTCPRGFPRSSSQPSLLFFLVSTLRLLTAVLLHGYFRKPFSLYTHTHDCVSTPACV